MTNEEWSQVLTICDSMDVWAQQLRVADEILERAFGYGDNESHDWAASEARMIASQAVIRHAFQTISEEASRIRYLGKP